MSGELLANAKLGAGETVRWMDPAGPLVISFVAGARPGHYRLRHADEIIVDILHDRQIVTQVRAGLSQTTLDHFLADQVLPRAKAHSGDFVLHAGAVRVDDEAILLMGASGRGKSTLVTSLDSAGLALLGDDAMVISCLDDRPRTKAVYPSLRLLPDSIAALFSESWTTTKVAHYSSKRRIDVPRPNVGSIDSVAIAAIFIIAEPVADAPINLRRMTVPQACITFVENSFALDPSDTSRAADRLAAASALARRVPTFELSYPRDYGQLAKVREHILDRVKTEWPA